MMTEGEIVGRLAAVRARIVAAAKRGRLSPQDVRILAVSKAHGAEVVRAALRAGLTDFGENYVGEAVAKMDAPRSSGARWHFIGRLQSNKARLVAERFDWMHTVIRERDVLRLNARRPADSPPLNVCIQVRMQDGDDRPALPADEAPGLAALIGAQKRLRLRGLMGMPMPGAPDDAYRRLRALFDELNGSGLGLDTLSMGMTADLETAVECGATLVRVGTALFGPRPRPR
ncbi:MAG: YggS family pyridoxal phosphate-dependent enzyme [Gammaproteobacteria bacterium]|nr:YggS family pyridoxal phosphate-dependent enzyme [Gammaproteobacteria bacterium]MCY4165794.1 YggS family pyridoxal phosphate-dependent enzyme [Gammaproteobacteria bacterium]MCY4256310.1 YggS family pyridoxal phosphate-dependent enzyme [Gammaproteobacteria bacterium]MCY4341915.1 YggS family pyridoxal phosphate-dependent enzyme [Gammaproteobacteria bacterium]